MLKLQTRVNSLYQAESCKTLIPVRMQPVQCVESTVWMLYFKKQVFFLAYHLVVLHSSNLISEKSYFRIG